MSTYFTELKVICDVIEGQITKYYSDGEYLILSIFAVLCLYSLKRDLRYKFLLPICVIMLITWNPILYRYVFCRIVYWRLMWMMPTVLLVSVMIVCILREQKNVVLKWLLVLVIGVCITTNETNVFINNKFYDRQCWEKISSETIQVCDIIMDKNQKAKAVVPTALVSEIRQYAPEISLIYGRNAVGYIRYMEWYYKDLYKSMNNGEYEYVLLTAISNELNFIIVPRDKEIEKQLSNKYGYQEVGRTAGYIVYYNEEIEYVL